MDNYQQFIHQRTYARFLPEFQRRETWKESVRRYYAQTESRLPDDITEEDWHNYLEALATVEATNVMPSMRFMHASGPALEKENLCGYNCSYLLVDTLSSFSELLYLLMCGAGVGFSVESEVVAQLPPVLPRCPDIDHRVKIVVQDSREGWAIALKTFVHAQWMGHYTEVDLSKLRPEGAPLKTFGGRSSGPEPLRKLFQFIEEICNTARSDRNFGGTGKIHTDEAFDICCMIAQCVISGGSRRSATIALFDYNDMAMVNAKNPEIFAERPWRAYSNISAIVYDDTHIEHIHHLLDCAKRNGEPGMVNRSSLWRKLQEQGRQHHKHVGTNPCGEVVLRPRQLCNLTEVVLRPTDEVEDLMNKVEYATLLGAIQSTFTTFNENVMHPDWRLNSEEDRLLGVSLTGIADCPWMQNSECLVDMLREHARLTAQHWSKLLGINMPKAITTIKPSGTVSQLVNASSGIHPRYAKFMRRNVQMSKTDPLALMMLDQKVPVQYPFGPDKDPVFGFFIKAPKDTITRHDVSAISQLETWKFFSRIWCDHQPSQTIYVRQEEWQDVYTWVERNLQDIVGLTFFPMITDQSGYAYLPFEEIDEEQFLDYKSQEVTIDFSKLKHYEKGTDRTEGAKEYACAGGACTL